MNDEKRRAGRKRPPVKRRAWLLALLPALGLAACTPRIEVAAPSEPITINLNIKLDADVRLRVEEKAKQDVATKSIF